MVVSKAVVTAAGRDAARQAMLPIVDRDGLTKPVFRIIAEEALESGVERILVVVAPGDEAVYRGHLRDRAQTPSGGLGEDEGALERARRLADLEDRLAFVVQEEPEGYGHAVWLAREFVGDDPFLLLLSDHLYLSSEPRRCARQVIDLAAAEGCAVSAVQATREHLIHRYGTLAGRRLADRPDVYAVEEIVEKPDATLAELKLHVPGLRAGHYLCFFGMHVLTPGVFELLDEAVREDRRESGSIQLTAALAALARREKYLALETRGRRFDLGGKFGAIEAQVALAMAGVDRDRILAVMLDAAARAEQPPPR